jgi:2-methylcitrate dehydratase PrpD
MSMSRPMHTTQQQLVQQHARLLDAVITTATRTQLARLVADTLAIAWHARAHGVGATAKDTVGIAPGPIPVFGADYGASVLDAAFLNGVAAEALDFQEVLIDGRNNGHAAVVIVPALLALAGHHHIDSDALQRGLWIAFAANVVLARSLGRSHRALERGFRTTSLTAPLAAALGASLMLSPDTQLASNALGMCAAALPAGLLAAMSPVAGDYSEDKDLSVGWSARHAVHCVLLAHNGVSGPSDVLSGARGWLASYGFDSVDETLLHTEPESIDLSAYALKYFPVNFGCQCAVALTLDLAQRYRAEQVASLQVRVKSSSAESLSTRSLDTHVAARFSLPYAVASAFVRQRSVLADFEPAALTDPAVGALMQRIELIDDATLEELHHEKGVFPARLKLVTTGGETVEAALDHPQQDVVGASRVDNAETIKAGSIHFQAKLEQLCPPAISAMLVQWYETAAGGVGFADIVDSQLWPRP